MRLWTALLKFGFQTDLLRKNSAGAVAFDFSNQSHALVMLQFLCSDSLKFDRWVHVENLCSIWKLAYWWLKLTDFCVIFWCFQLSFPLDEHNEIQLPSRFFCYSLLVCLLGIIVYWVLLYYCLLFLVEKSTACQSHRKSAWMAPFSFFTLLDT